jgi:hypothetical protein
MPPSTRASSKLNDLTLLALPGDILERVARSLTPEDRAVFCETFRRCRDAVRQVGADENRRGVAWWRGKELVEEGALRRSRARKLKAYEFTASLSRLSWAMTHGCELKKSPPFDKALFASAASGGNLEVLKLAAR